MTGIRFLPAQGRVPRAWRNGGGITRDIAAAPEGASDEDFLWRASIATIAAAGPFSSFPGVDRAFMLLRGDLRIEIGHREQHLRPGSPALLFGGEDEVQAEPIGGECTVLNIMTRRGRMLSKLTSAWDDTFDTGTLLLLATEPTPVTAGAAIFHLAEHDALLVDRLATNLLPIDPTLIAVHFVRDQLVQ